MDPIATPAAVTAIKGSVGLISKAAALLGRLGKKISAESSYELRTAHDRYCSSVILKYCRARTFFSQNEPQHLADFYVPSTITTNRQDSYARASLATLDTVTGHRTIITGTGGSGKTIFMRHLLLDSIKTGAGYPIFIELRNLTSDQYSNIEGAVGDFMENHGFPLDRKYVKKSIEEGLLVIILDGFDEVPSEQRKKLEISIKKMMANATSRIIISSRPDMTLQGWEDFTTAAIAPLSLRDACDLINKINYDGEEETKQRFIAILKKSLFNSHKYFLSNPLLLSIMLLTYGNTADIPTKFASFYEQAYIALFQRHDALKSGYKREKKTDLGIFEFSRLFAAFCAISYRDKRIKFTALDAIDYTRRAITVSSLIDVVAEHFIDDAKQAACLLIEDGLDITFVHRSFQEYFTARFINDSNDEVRIKYLNEIVSEGRNTSDNVIHLLHEINPHFVEESYLIPSLNKLFGDRKKKKITRATWAPMYTGIVGSIDFSTDAIISYRIDDHRTFGLLLIMKRILALPRGLSEIEQAAQIITESKLGDARFDELKPRSAHLTAIGKIPGEFGIDVFERFRVELIAMEARAQSRKTELSSLFD
ncbi:NACHT domain-containing protein [Stenotrophomonas sp. CFBP 13724]|uniref:NACHT domain-containing protein n=1 Tax=Stenotrophomonas sp. CFBP 13724 TaxID=2775298 RepID=UPI0017805046|nr:NACHT domain-containing protein [Stenotrophomonas sp. CFBP 13724]MBD8643701.1 NACHT domain-containing protein [Stenotrophomonas sp. CFBP 13724]